MRVGALPQYPSNALNYNLTWSTDGVINEYCEPCEAIVEGELIADRSASVRRSLSDLPCRSHYFGEMPTALASATATGASRAIRASKSSGFMIISSTPRSPAPPTQAATAKPTHPRGIGCIHG